MFSLEVEILKRMSNNFGVLLKASPEKYALLWSKVNKIELFWKKTDEGYQTKTNNQIWRLRINQNTGDPRCTLFIGKKAILSCDILPDNWHLSSDLG